jgi:AcrR family transcriptional regulator
LVTKTTAEDQLREELITAAHRLLENGHGQEGLSVGAIARELGIPARSVYDYFPDKMSLAYAVYQRYLSLLAHHIGRMVTEFTEPGEKLRAVAVGYCQFAADNPDAYYVMFTLPGIAGSADEFANGQRPGTEVIALVREVIGECVMAGVMHPVDPFQATMCLWASLHGLITLRRNRPQAPWPPFENLVDTLLAGLLCEPPA